MPTPKIITYFEREIPAKKLSEILNLIFDANIYEIMSKVSPKLILANLKIFTRSYKISIILENSIIVI